MIKLIDQNLQQINLLHEFLLVIKHENYTKKLPQLIHSSIGMHTRHIIEFYLCLMNSFHAEGQLNYDLRQRDQELELDIPKAIKKLDSIRLYLRCGVNANQSIILVNGAHNEEVEYHLSSIKRELLYLCEHTTHHMATIRIATLIQKPDFQFPYTFGLAVSTLTHQKAPSAANG
jgi:hypothetical protein